MKRFTEVVNKRALIHFLDSESKESTCNAADLGSIPGLRRPTSKGNNNPLQYSCMENFKGKRAWWATVHGVAKSWARLSD